MALINDRGVRLGALPPLWTLPSLLVAAVVASRLLRLRTPESWPLVLTGLLWLPWLPARIPAGWLVWEGPLEFAVWLLAVGGVVASRVGPGRRQVFAPLARPRVAPWIVGSVAFVGAIAAASALSDRIPGGDEPHYLIITQSLLTDGDLRIQNNHERGDDLAYSADPLAPDFLRRGVDGEIYSVHAPGLPVLMLPAVLLAGYPGAVAFIALVSACGLVLSWRTAHQLTESATAAWVATAAVGLSAPMAFHSFAVFPDPVGAAIVAAAFAVLVQWEVNGARVQSPYVIGLGALLAVLPWLHTRFGILAAAVGLVVLVRLWGRPDRWRNLLLFGLAPALSCAAWLTFFKVLYGTANPAAPYGNSEQNNVEWIGRGLTGLLLDQQFGLLASAPVMVFLLYGAGALARGHRRLLVEIAAITMPYVLVVASFGMWWAGWSAPARFLVPLLPLTIPLLASAWRRAGPALRALFLVSTLIGVANMALRLVLFDGRLLYNRRDGSDLLLDWLSQTINLPLAFPSVHRSGATLALLNGMLWVGAAGVVLWLLNVAFRRTEALGARWAITGLIVSVALTPTMSLAWQIERGPAMTPESSQVEFLRRWDASLRPTVVELPSLGSSPASEAFNRLEVRSSARARDVAAEGVLFAIPWLPGGSYHVVIEGAQALAGVLTLTLGMTSQVVDSWPLETLAAGDAGLRVWLPAAAQTVVIRGDDLAKSRITRVALRPDALGSPADSEDHVVRAARYGRVQAYLLDNEIFMEPEGLWTRGHSVARLVLRSDGDHTEVDLQAGAVPEIVRVAAGRWSAREALAAGERRRIRVPTDVLPMTLETSGAFRPVDHDPSSHDRRSLGVRLEFPK